MAVDKVTGPIFASDTSTGVTGPIAAKLAYEVSFTTNTETAVDALNADDGTTAIPVKGSAHPSNATLILKEKSAQRIQKSALFRVVLTYGTNDSTTIGDKGTEPLSRPVRWSSAPRGTTQEIDRDAGGTPIKTVPGEVVVTSIPYSDKGLVAVMNEAIPASGLPPDYDAYFNKVNDAVFKGYAARRLLLTGVSSQFTEELFDGDTEQYYVTRFQFNLLIKRTSDANDPDTWDQRILHEGIFRRDPSDATKKLPIVDERNNTLVTAPVLLDSSGQQLDSSGTPLFLNTGGAAPTAAGKLEVFLDADFSLLGL